MYILHCAGKIKQNGIRDTMADTGSVTLIVNSLAFSGGGKLVTADFPGCECEGC